jgi:NAD(P)-dependent dehydrogenase (short-subunit alcohol dehydrogenase family)
MIPISLEGRVALVTGGSRGIGKVIALELARAGADVAVNYRREKEGADETVAAIEKMGRKARAYAASVDDFDACQRLADEVAKDFGGFSILINNAGIASRGQSVADTDPAEFERVMRIQAFAPHYMSKTSIPYLRQHPRSDIIIISSVATMGHGANGAPYNMGKAASEALALTLAKEEQKHGMRVNIVAPSLTVSDMGDRLARAVAGVKDIHELDAKSPFGRVSVPDDVAAAVVWLVSDANPYASGQKINIDGAGSNALR